MNKTEFLSASLPYGLKFMSKGLYEDAVMLLHGVVFSEVCSQYGRFSIKDVKPIIRPLDSLTKECVQSDYNNGKPFVPALELVKLEEKYNKWVDIAPSIPYDIKIIQKPFGKVLKVTKAEQWVVYLSLTEMERARHYVIQQLIKWHFWPNMPEGEEVVYVTDEFNPYK